GNVGPFSLPKRDHRLGFGVAAILGNVPWEARRYRGAAGPGQLIQASEQDLGCVVAGNAIQFQLDEWVVLRPAGLWLCGILFAPRGGLGVNRRLRILRRPGEPLTLDAVHPGEPWSPFDRPAGDVPVQAGPLVNERRRRLPLPIDPEDPPGVPLEARGTERLMISRRGPGRAIPEHQARLAVDTVMDYAGLRH